MNRDRLAAALASLPRDVVDELQRLAEENERALAACEAGAATLERDLEQARERAVEEAARVHRLDMERGDAVEAALAARWDAESARRELAAKEEQLAVTRATLGRVQRTLHVRTAERDAARRDASNAKGLAMGAGFLAVLGVLPRR